MYGFVSTQHIGCMRVLDFVLTHPISFLVPYLSIGVLIEWVYIRKQHLGLGGYVQGFNLQLG